MKLRVRIAGLSAATLHALERKTRLLLGRDAAAIDTVEVSLHEDDRHRVHHADCEVTVTLRDGSTGRVHDDASQVHRALLRAAWRIEQRRYRRELARLGEGHESRSARSTA